ncbi:glutamate ABC transporter substrate-binding protein [Aquipuribacter hungaricus]|uniref:glutamate ABC transporter substrate-binding protein n=1 Tax=Aquipuribacter hungaricus TaxID=545624 RepID=UPI0036221545
MTTRRLMPGLALLSAAALALAACGGGSAEEDAAEATGAAGDAVAEETTEAGDGASESAAPAEFPAGSTMAELSEAGTLRVGTKFDQPGFGLANLDGTPEGFDVEIAKIVADALGIPEDGITYTETPSAIREEVLETDQVDLVAATYTINDTRRERITFAGPYYVAGQALMVRTEDAETISAPEDLSDTSIRVCSVEGSTPSETIREYLGSPDQLTLFAGYSECADSLANDQVDVVTTDNVILLGLVSESDGAFTLSGETFTDEPYGIGIAKGDVEFCEFINETLAAADEDGRYLEAWESTAGSIEGAQAPELPAADECV